MLDLNKIVDSVEYYSAYAAKLDEFMEEMRSFNNEKCEEILKSLFGDE